MRGLQDKVVVIAGGGTGIGAATARRMASEGARVVIGDLRPEAADALAGELAGAVGVGFDISTEAGVDALFGAALDAFGAVDLVHVNAADLSPDTVGADSDAVDVPLDVFDRTIAVNLRGHLLVTRRAIPLLLPRRGALVYTSSAAAFAGEPMRPSYAMSKSGLLALVRHVASRWGREGVRANAVTPGLVITEALAGNVDESFREYALSLARSPRLGRPEDIAAAVAFLLSDDAEWINGQVIGVDGGTLLR